MTKQEIQTAIRELSEEIAANRNQIKQLQKSGKWMESSSLQSELVSDRLTLRAYYLAYGLMKGRSLNVIEKKTLKTRPEGDYQMKFLCEQFWRILEGNYPLQKESALKMLKTHLGR